MIGYKKIILENQNLLEIKMGRGLPNSEKLHLQIVLFFSVFALAGHQIVNTAGL